MPPGPDDFDFTKKAFTTRHGTAAGLASRALSFVSQRRAVRLLDLGCGTGDAGIAGARERGDIRVVALDLSPVNVAAARAAADAAGVGARVTTVCADYIHWVTPPFDAIVSDSVLHAITSDNVALAERLAQDLVPGGVLLATLPVESCGNTLRIVARRLWRLMPCSADSLAVTIARRLHPEFSRSELAERASYLRLIPARLMGRRLAGIMANAGFEMIEQAPWDSVSIAKLDHRLVVWRRR